MEGGDGGGGRRHDVVTEGGGGGHRWCISCVGCGDVAHRKKV